MRTVETFRAELVYSRQQGRSSASAIVPPEQFAALDAEKIRLGCKTRWWYDADPHTGTHRTAFTPIEGKRLAMIESKGIRHGDRFIATVDVREVQGQRGLQRQMWMVDARPVSAATAAALPEFGFRRFRIGTANTSPALHRALSELLEVPAAGIFRRGTSLRRRG